MNNPEQEPLPEPGASVAEPSVDVAAVAETSSGSNPSVDTDQVAQAKSPGGEVTVDPIPDTRLYVPDNEDWDVHIKRDSERLFCYSKHPGQDWFHLLLNGEIYVSRQHEKYCLRCALRMGFLTVDRLFWQHRVPKLRNRIAPLT